MKFNSIIVRTWLTFTAIVSCDKYALAIKYDRKNFFNRKRPFVEYVLIIFFIISGKWTCLGVLIILKSSLHNKGKQKEESFNSLEIFYLLVVPFTT